ncbi:MAG: hypothetical protein WCW46_03850 [Candidatus Paceibacterota bacterium]|jgi:hypothetical protein
MSLAFGFFISGIKYWKYVAYNRTMEFGWLQMLIIFVFLLGGIHCFFVAERYYHKFVNWVDPDTDRRPIVRVWTHNEFTRVAPELDWKLWHQLYERNLAVGLAFENTKPDPKLVILFSDLPTDRKTGDMKDCNSLLSRCKVEESQMVVARYDNQSVDFSIAWKIIHGSDEKSLTK